MGEMEFLGYLVCSLVTLGGFIAVIMKFVQPINDLRVVIQKLNDNIDALKNDNTQQNARIDNHEGRIGGLEHKVEKMQTKMEIYHKE
jgi:hypothetical protein